MIIAGFGDTVGGMYTFPTSMMDDDHRVALPSATKAMPLTSGVLDVRGTNRNRRAAQTIGKAFVLTQDPVAIYAAGTDLNYSSSTHTDTLSHGNIAPGTLIIHDSFGLGTDDGAGLLYDSTAAPRGTIDYNTGTYTVYADFFNNINSFSYSYRSGFTDPWVTLGTALDALRLATIGQDKSKLWALERGGTYRWTWAKCIKFKAPEKVGALHHCEVSLSFRVDDPIWYSENAHTGSLAAGTNALTNAGNSITPVIVRLTAVTAPCTAFEFRNLDDVNRVTFAGSVATGKVFTVDGGKRSATNDGAAAYSTITKVGTGPWLYLPAGVSGIKWQSSTGGAPTATYEYYDAWVM
jgi:hypothetical protein